MRIIFHAHHASISDQMRRRAEVASERAASRLSRAVDAIIRFEQDGRLKRVEIILHSPRHRDLVAQGEARFYGTALSTAIQKLTSQVRKMRTASTSSRRLPAMRKAARA